MRSQEYYSTKSKCCKDCESHVILVTAKHPRKCGPTAHSWRPAPSARFARSPYISSQAGTAYGSRAVYHEHALGEASLPPSWPVWEE